MDAPDPSFDRFVGRSPVVRELETVLRQAAGLDSTVLLSGETGTGKGIVAPFIHAAGHRAAQPFVTVSCPNLPLGMVETELFGHTKGAFTGAVSDRIGKVQAAEKGTLFLDEVGELPLDLQPKVLRLLQEKTYERVGDPREHRADVRVIAATNRDLDEEVRAGRFRQDLHARLNYIPIVVPPLRERREDIPLLLDFCLGEQAPPRTIGVAVEARAFLERLEFSWPLNVRHLKHLAARLALDPSEPATPDRLWRLLQGEIAAARDAPRTVGGRVGRGLDLGLPTLIKLAEKEWLEEALRRYPDLTRAELAGKLEISEAALYRKLREHRLGAEAGSHPR